MVTTTVSRSLMDVVDVVLTLAKTRGPHKTAESLIFFFFFPLRKHKHLLSVLVCSSVDHILKALIKSCRL